MHTFSPVRACRYAVLADGAVSPACSDGTDKPKCYAEAMSRRNPAVLGTWGADGVRTFASEAYWRGPKKWNAEAVKAGVRARVFCSSLADIFEGADVDGVESREAIRPDYLPMLDRLFGLIEATPALDWLLLTKRPWNMAAYHRARVAGFIDAHGTERDDAIHGRVVERRPLRGVAWPGNIWPGTTTENQAAFDDRIKHLMRVPGVRFLSVEPMLGAVDASRWLGTWQESECCGSPDVDRHGYATCCGCPRPVDVEGVSWVICGTESDGWRPGKRVTNPAWIRSLRDQCIAAGVPFFLKQMNVDGKLVHDPELDGRQWSEVPDAHGAP